MQTALNTEFTPAVFKKELKNRFLCEVEIDGVSTVCYVPSSCHLSNFIKLEGRDVLLSKTKTKDSRTEYKLFAVKHKQNYILLNTSLANKAIENSIHSRVFCCLGKRDNIHKEHNVDGYKCDLFVDDTKTIIEIKSVLSVDPVAFFPTVFSERSLDQLAIIQSLLTQGYIIHYMIVALNPYVKTIHLKTDTLFFNRLKKCMDLGLKLSAYSCHITNNGIIVKSKVSLLMEE